MQSTVTEIYVRLRGWHFIHLDFERCPDGVYMSVGLSICLSAYLSLCLSDEGLAVIIAFTTFDGWEDEGAKDETETVL